MLLVHFCLCFLSMVCHLNATLDGISMEGVMDEIIDRSRRNKAVTFIALSDLLRHLPEQTEGKINCSGSHRSCHADTPGPTWILLSLAHSLLSSSHTYLPTLLFTNSRRPWNKVDLQIWQISDLWDDQSSDFPLRDPGSGANGPVG